MYGKTRLRKKQTRATALLWGAIYLICLLVIRHVELPTKAGIGISLVPVIFFFIFLITIIREVASMDELQRKIQTEAVIVAFLMGLLLLMTLGMLDQVIPLDQKHWGYLDMVPFMGLFYAIGWWRAHRKYS